MANRHQPSTHLLSFLADLYRCEPDGELKKRLKKDPEHAMNEYDLAAWQRELLFTLDRKKIAEAVYWEVVANDPYEGQKGPRVEWGYPRRAFLDVPDKIEIATEAKLAPTTIGLRPNTKFELVSYASGARFATLENPTSTGDLDKETWSLVFNLADAPADMYLRLVADDGSGMLASPAPIKTVAPKK